MRHRSGEGDPVSQDAILPQLTAFPLATWEREGVKAALKKVGLPAADVEAPNRLFWRFETADVVPVGFGGLELHGDDGLLRSVVTLPPIRGRGIGAAIVAILEVEARVLGCRALWLLTTSAAEFFAELGYAKCERVNVPQAIRETLQFAALCPASATVMTKRLD
jgi:N-acetylglutamate synthase-like GNAT family acetyltransferase